MSKMRSILSLQHPRKLSGSLTAFQTARKRRRILTRSIKRMCWKLPSSGENGNRCSNQISGRCVIAHVCGYLCHAADRESASVDVILTEKLFGDILSDKAAMITGSIGMLPSASIGGRVGIFELAHAPLPTLPERESLIRLRPSLQPH
jgi:hypothetical protein